MLQVVDSDCYPVTERTKAHPPPHCYPQCVTYERATIRAILKEGYVCHVGFVYHGKDSADQPDPYPVALPTLYAFDTQTSPERLYLHSSDDSRLYQTACKTNGGMPVCLTVSLVDNMFLGGRAFWHGVYYRSVMVYGKAIPVPDKDKKAALRVFVEHMFKGRWDDTGHPNQRELEQTGVLRLDLSEVSAKIQDGTKIPGGDTKIGKCGFVYEEDQDPQHWAGVIPSVRITVLRNRTTRPSRLT